jgi:hypothetical protein
MKVGFSKALKIYHENYFEIWGNLFALLNEGMVTGMEICVLTVILIL